jgi:serine/threonine protein kinase
MSLCINPRCLQPDHPANDGSRFCQSCGSELVLQERYRVMRLLSDKSGFGRVYEAYERSQPKILKVLKETHSRNAKAVELFHKEAIVLMQLHHPGIPRVEPDGYFQFVPRQSPDPLHCIVMEKIDGLNLREWMKQQGNHPISEKQALNWLVQLAEILHLVHQQNYFHRDIKPENIMLRSNGQLVLVDFGAAREMTYTYLAQLGGSSGVTRISSAGYTPPEQEQGQAVPQSDFYALGRTFIYLLTGRQPTDQGIYDSLHNEFHWRNHAPQVSPLLADFIDRLIAPKAADRPNNTQEILDRLVQIARAPALHQSNSTSALPVTVAQATPQPESETIHLKEFAPRRWWIGGAVALLIGLGSVGVWRYQQSVAPTVDSETLEPMRSLIGHSSFVNCLAISPDGTTLVSGSADSTIKLWNLATGANLRTLQGHSGYINAIDISPDGQTLVSGDANSTLKIWNLKTGALLHTLSGHSGYINAIDISPDGQTLVSASADGTLKVWNLATQKLLHTLSGHSGYINAIDISPDGTTLVSGGADSTIKVWDLSRSEVLHTLSGHTGFINALEISHDGKTVVSASADSTIKVWDLATQKLLHTLSGHASYVNRLAIQPDGKILVSSSADETIKVWDLQTGAELRTLTGADAPLDYFVVSPDWQTIATGKGDTTIRIWDFQD